MPGDVVLHLANSSLICVLVLIRMRELSPGTGDISILYIANSSLLGLTPVREGYTGDITILHIANSSLLGLISISPSVPSAQPSSEPLY